MNLVPNLLTPNKQFPIERKYKIHNTKVKIFEMAGIAQNKLNV